MAIVILTFVWGVLVGTIVHMEIVRKDIEGLRRCMRKVLIFMHENPDMTLDEATKLLEEIVLNEQGELREPRE